MIFTKSILTKYLEEDLIRVQKHPTEELFIYNYTNKTQFERAWDELTLSCRGLILDGEENIIARPFQKFFNLGEIENQVIPTGDFEVFEKMDGSLGILYWLNNQAYIATRGSFISEQSMVANTILNNRYASLIPNLDRSKTYLFEIIYPANRIVVNYGAMEDLVLLGIVDTATGKEETIKDLGFPVVKTYAGLSDINTLKTLEEENKEGFVIRFQNGLRYKIKFDEYVRIHRIIANVSNVSIWEYLKTGESLNELIERVPDEFYDWVKKTHQEFLDAYALIEKQCLSDYKVLATRKETAMYFLSCQYSQVLFAMLDQKDYAPIIWKMLRPKFSKPFFNT